MFRLFDLDEDNKLVRRLGLHCRPMLGDFAKVGGTTFYWPKKLRGILSYLDHKVVF